MEDISKIALAFFGGIITLAIVSSIVGQRSKAPEAIQSFGSAISNVVAAAVNPVSANYGYGSGGSTFSSPLTGILGANSSAAFLDPSALLAPITSGGFK